LRITLHPKLYYSDVLVSQPVSSGDIFDLPQNSHFSRLYLIKVKGPVFDIALLYDEHMLRSALQSQKW